MTGKEYNKLSNFAKKTEHAPLVKGRHPMKKRFSALTAAAMTALLAAGLAAGETLPAEEWEGWDVPSEEERAEDIFSEVPVETENSYRASDIACTYTAYVDEENFHGRQEYHVIDIHVRDARQIRSCFSEDRFDRLTYSFLDELCEEKGALAAVSGDYARNRSAGLVIRDGVVYREKLDNTRDIGVLYMDGTFETYTAKNVPLEEILSNAPWQCFSFGPELLDEEGHAKTEFNTDVEKTNPRAAFGYYEPGHYCFVVVEGRKKGAAGMTMEELSRLMEELGCEKAINLDGGRTAQIAWAGKRINRPDQDRRLNDMIYVCRETLPESEEMYPVEIKK